MVLSGVETFHLQALSTMATWPLGCSRYYGTFLGRVCVPLVLVLPTCRRMDLRNRGVLLHRWFLSHLLFGFREAPQQLPHHDVDHLQVFDLPHVRTSVNNDGNRSTATRKGGHSK